MIALKKSRRARWLVAGVLFVLSLGLAFSWLAPAMGFGQTPMSTAIKLILARERDVRKLVTRSGGGDGSQGLAISAQYGTPEFFAYGRREQDILDYQPRGALVFLLTESVGVGQLTDQPPTPSLKVDDGREYAPIASAEELQRWKVVTQSLNQRTSEVRFSRTALTPSTKSIDLIFSRADGTPSQTLRWDLPLAYPENIAFGEPLSFDSLLGVAAGLIYGHFTCLIQLAAVFFATVLGLATVAQTQTIKFGIRFVVGMVFVYTAAGAFAGWLGDAMQSSGLAYQWITPLSFASGVLVVLLALWMGVLAGAPMLNRIHLPAFASLETGAGRWLPLMMGASWALGCVTCFDGVMYPTLLVYTGFSGSVFVGGAILLLFSMGVGIAFLISSIAMRLGFALIPALNGKTLNTSRRNTGQGFQSVLVWVLVLIIVGLGVSMLTGNFHNVSNIAFQWLRTFGLF